MANIYEQWRATIREHGPCARPCAACVEPSEFDRFARERENQHALAQLAAHITRIDALSR